jgi:hypothetical protein
MCITTSPTHSTLNVSITVFKESSNAGGTRPRPRPSGPRVRFESSNDKILNKSTKMAARVSACSQLLLTATH